MLRAKAERALPERALPLAPIETGRARVPPAGQPIERAPLLRVAAQRRNLITDDRAWFERNGLLPSRTSPRRPSTCQNRFAVSR